MSDLAEIADQSPAFDGWIAVAQALVAVGCLGEVGLGPGGQAGVQAMQDELRHQR
jgi:hypothetical protein